MGDSRTTSCCVWFSWLLNEAPRWLLLVAALVIGLLLQFIFLFHDGATNMDIDFDCDCRPPQTQAPRDLRRNVSELLFMPEGIWVGNGTNATYMERRPDGSLHSVNLAAGEAARMLGGKWVYFWGDSTMRQLFTALLTDINLDTTTFEEAKRAFRHSPRQKGRRRYIPYRNDTGQCWKNEHSQHLDLSPTFGGPPVNLTYNWKHFIDEEYDKYFFAKELPELFALHKKLPDVLLISTGLHNCVHYGLTNLWENRRDMDSLLARVGAAAKGERGLPPIIWVDNVNVLGHQGNPECGELFNGYYRSRVVEEIEAGRHVGALVSREEMTWTAPEELWDDWRRVHYQVPVQKKILVFVLRAMRALGVESR